MCTCGRMTWLFSRLLNSFFDFPHCFYFYGCKLPVFAQRVPCASVYSQLICVTAREGLIYYICVYTVPSRRNKGHLCGSQIQDPRCGCDTGCPTDNTRVFQLPIESLRNQVGLFLAFTFRMEIST